MSFKTELPAGVLAGHMKRASFCSDIQDLLLEIKDGIIKTAAVGAGNDRIALIRTDIDTSESLSIGIPKISAVIDKLNNFAPSDIISLIIDDKNQMQILRKKPKKFYKISTVEDIKHIRSKTPYDIFPDIESLEFKIIVGEGKVQKAGDIKTILKISNLAAAQKIFKNKDVFTDEVELSIKTDGTIEIWGRDEDDIGSDTFEVNMSLLPEKDLKSGYSGLIEVIKALNAKADITVYAGDGQINLVITEELDSEKESYKSIYVIMPRKLRWK